MSAADERPGSESPPIINENPRLEKYYASLESRIGYRLLLGGTRHYGYYDDGGTRLWPFPIGRSLRRMEQKLVDGLGLPRGCRVLDAGCGVGHVALTAVRYAGLRVTAIDVVERHAARAQRNVARAREEKNITVRRMDYHHLESIADGSFDGVYTMETLVHATDPEAVLAGFFRILAPGGRIALHEYEHDYASPRETGSGAADRGLVESDMTMINTFAAMPTNQRSTRGFFQHALEDAGFVDVEVRDYSQNVRPMVRLFYFLAIVPYFFIRLFHLERYFINTLAGVRGHASGGMMKYVAISATKPGGPIEGPKTR